MGLLDACEENFNTRDLYVVFGVSRDASEADLKKAYKKASLLYHPDRVDDDKKEEATRKFQVISKVHSILSDKENRAVYDETGSIDDENTDWQDKDWKNYWRLLFPKVTKRDVDNFMDKYKGSEEELEDLKRYYIQCEGDMNKISEFFLSYDVEEEEKYRDILSDLINKKEIPDFPNFTKESKSKRDKRIKKFKKEAVEAEKISKEMDESLINAIAQRSASREKQFGDMMQHLEAKYCKSTNKKKKK